MIKFTQSKRRVFSTFFLSAILISCGGGSDDESSPQNLEGVFLDSTVAGLNYKTQSIEGITNELGKFQYKAGESVTFSIGDIVIGEAKGQAVITPINLVQGATDENNETVTNIARLLQTLDEDGNPDIDGIVISSEVRAKANNITLDFEVSINEFSVNNKLTNFLDDLSSSAGKSFTLIDQTAARDHFKSSLLAAYEGTYTGTFTGDDSGTWTFNINSLGNISGTASTSEGESIISGQLASDGSSDISGSAGSSSFSGAFSLDGTVTGTWTDTAFGESGTFRGNRTSKNILSNPTVNISGLGNVDISGLDFPGGITFEPNDGSSIYIGENQENLSANWIRKGTSAIDFKNEVIAITYSKSVEAVGVTYVRTTGTGNLRKIYAYSNVCGGPTTESCQNITVNTNDNTVSFNHFELSSESESGNTAQGTITLLGTLNLVL